MWPVWEAGLKPGGNSTFLCFSFFFFFFFAPLFPGVNKKQMWRTMVGEVGEEGGGWTASQTGGREGREGRERLARPTSHSCASPRPPGQSPVILRIQSSGNRTGRPEEGQLEPGGGGSRSSLREGQGPGTGGQGGPENRLPSEVQKRRAEGTEGGTDRSPRRKEEGEREGSGPAAKEEACGWGLQAGSWGLNWLSGLSPGATAGRRRQRHPREARVWAPAVRPGCVSKGGPEHRTMAPSTLWSCCCLYLLTVATEAASYPPRGYSLYTGGSSALSPGGPQAQNSPRPASRHR